MARIKGSKKNLISVLLILSGLTLLLYKYYPYYYENKQEITASNKLIESTSKSNLNYDASLSTNEIINKSQDNDYIGVLEIPNISFKRRLVNTESKKNNVNYNIQILKDSDMPNIENGLLIIAGHSGNSKVSYFSNLSKVNNNDLINIYYNNKKYIYKITNVYMEQKTGTINIEKNRNKTTLVLTTCSKAYKNKQLVVISELIDSKEY